MNIRLTVSPSMVPTGTPASLTITIANDGDPLAVTDVVVAVDVALVDLATVRLTPVSAGWTTGAPSPDGTHVRFHAVAPAGTVLLTDGAVAFSMPTSAGAHTGDVGAVVLVSGAPPVTATPVSVSVTTEVAFTSLGLNPAQVGPDVPSTLSWSTVGASGCVLQWTPAIALSVQSGGTTSPPGASSMTLPASGQATLTPAATAHLTITAVGGDVSRQEQLDLWLPSLALRVGSGHPGVVLDPTVVLTVPYWAETVPDDPTSIRLTWSGSSAYVAQGGTALGNGAAIAAPSGEVTVVMTADTTLTFDATTPSGLSSVAVYPITIGKKVPINLYAGGWFNCQALVTAVAEDTTFTLATSSLPLGQTGTVYVPADSTSVSVTIQGWWWGWETIMTTSWSDTAGGYPGASYRTDGTAFDMSASQT